MKITLRAARINSDMTIKEVAGIIRVSDEVLRNFERGRTAIPKDKLDRLLKLYEMTIDELKEEKRNG